MNKFMFLLAFLAGFAFAGQVWAAEGSPTVNLGPVGKGGTFSPEPHGEDLSPDDPGLIIDDDNSSASGVTKSRAFTPAEAADATKDNSKNSVTINF